MKFFGKKKGEGEEKKDAGASADGDGAAPANRLQPSDAEKAKARRFFEHAQSVADTRNYDYAIECYVSGLELWPEAVAEGHMKLRLVAQQRRGAGKDKKPDLKEKMKRKTSTKDPFVNMLNAEYLWAKDPTNLSYMTALFQNAVKAGCDATSLWFGPILHEAAAGEKKLNLQRFVQLRDRYVELAERFEAQEDAERSCEAYDRAIVAVLVAHKIKPGDSALVDDSRILATRRTIVRGRFDTADSFKDSMRDTEAQRDLHDVQRMVQAGDRVEELVAKARAEYAGSNHDATKALRVADLLCKREETQYENEAIEFLSESYEQGGKQNYRLLMEADNIRMRQMRRERREATAALKQKPDDAERKQRLAGITSKQVNAELRIYGDRVKAYPTDLGIRAEYGKRLFATRQFDEAIPVLQAARGDPKNRVVCGLYLGRCFFEKGYHAQAVDVLQEVTDSYEIDADDTSKALRYWLARGLEAEGKAEEAVKGFGKLLQWDYDYRDVRQRIDKLASNE